MSSFDEEKATSAPKETARSAATEGEAPTQSSTKVWALLFGLVFLAGVAVAITVPIVHYGKESSKAVVTPGPPLETETPTSSPAKERTPVPPPFTAFNVSLNNFDSAVLLGYETEEEFSADLGDALRLLIDRVLARNLGYHGYEMVGVGLPPESFAFADGAVPCPGLSPDLDQGSGNPEEGSGNPERGSVGDDQNDYGTNNQEDGVEEGDVVVASAEFMFTAYGDYILVFDTTTGMQLVDFKLPPLDGTEPEPESPPIFPDPELPGPEPEDPPERRRASLWYYPNRASIRSMLLHGTKLLVVADGYGIDFRYNSANVIDSYLGTRLMIFETASMGGVDGGLELISTKDISGSFVSLRSIEGDVHVVTTSGFNYYHRLVTPFERYNNRDLAELSDEDYIATVMARANEKAIPEFIRIFLDDVRVDGQIPFFARITNWDDGEATNLAPYLYPEGYLSSMALIYSFDIDSVIAGEELTGVSTAGAILPSYGANIYANEETLIISTSGTGYSEEREAAMPKTYLMSFKLDGPTSQPHTVGSLFGDILNQYSMDVRLGVLRIAVTIRNVWFWGRPEILIDEPVGDEINEDPVEDEPMVWAEPTTENYIVTLSLDGADIDSDSETPAVMEELDRVKIGKPMEVITGIRFYDIFAYAATFVQRDPFYKINVADPSNIEILAEVDITGFSQYLHAFDDAEEMIVAIGQETDDDGFILGLTISLFDMRDAANPTVVRYSIELEPDTYSSSEALWDKNAIRFTKITDDEGILIIPVNINSWPEGAHFNGFKLFSITPTSIVEDERCSVEVGGDVEIEVCRYCSSLPARALIFGGSVVTMKEHSLTRTDLDTCGTDWDVDVFIQDLGNDCC